MRDSACKNVEGISMLEPDSAQEPLGEHGDIATLSILRLLSLLKPAQVRAVLAVIVTVVSGTFGFDHKYVWYA